MARKEVRFVQTGAGVLMLLDGQLALEMSWENALEVANALRTVAKNAEEYAKANEIVNDQAILMRSGFPIDLTTHPDILKEAAKEAAWDSNLRRAMPGGIKSQERFGKPTIVRHPLKKDNGNV